VWSGEVRRGPGKVPDPDSEVRHREKAADLFTGSGESEVFRLYRHRVGRDGVRSLKDREKDSDGLRVIMGRNGYGTYK
jgi:hypothetical protein